MTTVDVVKSYFVNFNNKLSLRLILLEFKIIQKLIMHVDMNLANEKVNTVIKLIYRNKMSISKNYRKKMYTQVRNILICNKPIRLKLIRDSGYRIIIILWK